MPEARRCSTCGTEISAGFPEGLCPRCMLEAGLGSGPVDPAQIPTQRSPAPSGFVPPEPEELAARFPQLEILELLGKGGMGAVYKARQRGLDRLVAVKILPPDVSHDPAFAERFTREARALGRLSHPNIVAVHDFGQADGLYYFVMEYVDGTNLRQAIHAGRMAPQDALAIIPQICDALQFAHDEGVVHRDIKPENILIDQRGRVKIADFGLAKLLGQDQPDQSLTGTHQVMGTLRYMAPEQMEGTKQVDHRADIYSLGVVFYELLTGELPLGRFAPPSKKVQIDVRLDEVVLRALEKEPEQRYQHASDVKTEVEQISTPPQPGRRDGRRPSAVPSRDDASFVPAADRPKVSPEIRRQLQGPAIALMIYGLFVLFPALLCFTNGFDIADGNDATPSWAGFGLMALAFFLLGPAVLMIRGGWHMLAQESYRAAFLGSILGQPIGLWGLIVLSRPEVKTTFASVSQSQSRPRLVPVLATFDLLAGLAMMFTGSSPDPMPFEESTPAIWRNWAIVDAGLAFVWGLGFFCAAIGLFLWKPWGRKLVIASCIFGLAGLVIDMPYITRAVHPHLVADLMSEMDASGMSLDDRQALATSLAAYIIGGASLVILVGCIGQLVYFSRPKVVAAFASQEESSNHAIPQPVSNRGIAATVAAGNPMPSGPRPSRGAPQHNPWATRDSPHPAPGTPVPARFGEAGARGEEFDRARRQVQSPAIGLLVFGILQWLSIGVPAYLMLSVDPEYSASRGYLSGLVVELMLTGGLLTFASMRMQSLEARGVCVLAALVAVVAPFIHLLLLTQGRGLMTPGDFIGPLLGLWALAVLGRRDVKEAFRAMAPPEPPSANGGAPSAQPPVQQQPMPMLLGVAIGLVMGLLIVTAGVVLVPVAFLVSDPFSGPFWGWMGGAIGCIVGGLGSLAGSWNTYRQLRGQTDWMKSPRWTSLDSALLLYGAMGLGMLAAPPVLSMAGQLPLIMTAPVKATFHGAWLMGGMFVFQSLLFLVFRFPFLRSGERSGPSLGVGLAAFGAAALAAATVGAALLIPRQSEEVLFYTYHGDTGFVEGPTGPRLGDGLAIRLRISAAQRQEADRIFQKYYQEFLSLERRHTRHSTDEKGHVHITVEPFPDESLALVTTLASELAGVVEQKSAPFVPQRGKIHTQLGLFRHAGEATVKAELWKEKPSPDGTTHHMKESVTWIDGSSTGRGSSGTSTDAFPREYRIFWVEE